jgi:hypothetical protein
VQGFYMIHFHQKRSSKREVFWGSKGRWSHRTLSSAERQGRCSARRRSPVHFINHATDCIAQLLDHMLISWKRVALCMIEDESRIRVAHIVKSDIAVQVRVQRTNCINVSGVPWSIAICYLCVLLERRSLSRSRPQVRCHPASAAWVAIHRRTVRT